MRPAAPNRRTQESATVPKNRSSVNKKKGHFSVNKVLLSYCISFQYCTWKMSRELFFDSFSLSFLRWSLKYWMGTRGSGGLGPLGGLMVRVGHVTWRLWVWVSVPTGIVGGGSECTALSSTFNTMTEEPLSNLKLLPGHWCKMASNCSRCVCSLLTAVCVWTWMGKRQSTDSKYGMPYLATCHGFHFSISKWFKTRQNKL